MSLSTHRMKKELQKYRIVSFFFQILQKIGLLVLVFWSLFPIYWLLVSSFRRLGNDFDLSPLPKAPTLDNYYRVIETSPIFSTIFNSTLVASSTVIISFLIGVSAAYAIARLPFRGKNMLVYFLLILYALPAISFLTGLYQIIDRLNLLNSPIALIVSYTMFILPFAVWLLSSFIQSLPYELEEAAQMDGHSPLSILFRVVIPLLKPAIASFSILAFIGCWNEFLFALSFLYDDHVKTVTLLIPFFVVDVTGGYTPFTVIAAACVIAMIPLILVLIFGYRYIISGITLGAVKG